ncbi:MAG TPA: hypothetical protein VMM15_02840 [Bradyrhizobium sp.]|nr:hypothetical protein [Bradyrhizobium sp.]
MSEGQWKSLSSVWSGFDIRPDRSPQGLTNVFEPPHTFPADPLPDAYHTNHGKHWSTFVGKV